MGVELGVVLPARTRPAPLGFGDLLRIAEDVDANSRWGQLWVPDSILALPFYDSTVLLAASAARTRRVQLGVACLASLGFRHPVIVAQEWANLDVLSGGRMVLVACRATRPVPPWKRNSPSSAWTTGRRSPASKST